MTSFVRREAFDFYLKGKRKMKTLWNECEYIDDISVGFVKKLGP